MKFETNVKEIILRTHNVKSFRFHRPESLNYKPGQFMFLTIKIEEKEARKHFTISSSPTEREFIEFTKKLTGHSFSDALDALKVGDWVEIEAPYGNFTFEGQFKKIGMISGGIGITPLRSICKYCTDMLLETKITLLYGNHTEKDIIFRKEFEEMQQQNKNLKVVFTVSEASESWTGYTGRIDTDMIKKEVPDYKERVFYICGPPGMVKAMANLLEELDVSKENIRKEIFPGY
ncbi:MAG: FAD-dependent oxidoreductase [archaeon]|nr:FAD-dependent oxidoreductase [archaeon]MCP8306725.1 FAD-dependent oxidoreductase [archaeon]